MRVFPVPTLTAAQVRMFLSCISFGAADECWEYGNGASYGRFMINSHSFIATRIAMRLFAGVDPMERFVCHKCDNPPCVNPTHLYVGTNVENQLDATTRSRGAKVIRAKYLNSPMVVDSNE